MLEFPGGLDSGRNDFDIKTGARYSMDGWWVEHCSECPQFCWEKAMAPHSSTLAWKILWMEEPGSLLHGVAKSLTLLSDFTFTFHFLALEKEMAHSSILAWRIPGTGELGGLPSMGSHRAGHD